MADVAVLRGRVGTGRGRPLLGDDPHASLQRLLKARAPAYAEAHAVIDTGASEPAEVAAEVVALKSRAPIVVPLGLRTYRVEVGCGTRHAGA